ncbi:MAG: nicotinamide riboside transporter PnuC [Pseudomonadota bacterium]
MDATIGFLAGLFDDAGIEVIALCLGIINVGLLMRRSIWNYPFGIAMVSLYAFIFYEARLYSDMLLQGFFFAIQIYGWWYWAQNLQENGHIHVRRLHWSGYPGFALAALIGVMVLGTFMSRFTDADLAYWDATTTVLSVIATMLLARRYLENWIVWIIVDVLAIGIYYAKGLYPTAVLYLIFLAMASGGLVMWWRAMATQETSYEH